MDVKAFLALFNVKARTEFNRGFQSIKPEIDGLLYEYPSGPVEKMNFPFFGFFQGMKKFTGKSEFESFPEAMNFYVTNEEWQEGVEILAKYIDRAAGIGDLNLYVKRIGELPQVAAEHPYELALDMLEAGDANTYGTCFDAQNLFDTTHSYSTSAGSQSNLLSGTGTTESNVITDLNSALAALNGFYIQQGGTSNSKKRKLNKRMKLVVVCPDELYTTFWNIKTKARLSAGETNPWQNRFEVVSRPFSDDDDWYLINVDNSDNLSLFLYQVEKPVELEYPSETDESYKKEKKFQWNMYGRYAVAYGAWWKGVMTTNT
jgi:phage major head subunit gpT-like protein